MISIKQFINDHKITMKSVIIFKNPYMGETVSPMAHYQCRLEMDNAYFVVFYSIHINYIEKVINNIISTGDYLQKELSDHIYWYLKERIHTTMDNSAKQLFIDDGQKFYNPDVESVLTHLKADIKDPVPSDPPCHNAEKLQRWLGDKFNDFMYNTDNY